MGRPPGFLSNDTWRIVIERGTLRDSVDRLDKISSDTSELFSWKCLFCFRCCINYMLLRPHVQVTGLLGGLARGSVTPAKVCRTPCETNRDTSRESDAHAVNQGLRCAQIYPVGAGIKIPMKHYSNAFVPSKPPLSVSCFMHRSLVLQGGIMHVSSTPLPCC